MADTSDRCDLVLVNCESEMPKYEYCHFDVCEWHVLCRGAMSIDLIKFVALEQQSSTSFGRYRMLLADCSAFSKSPFLL